MPFSAINAPDISFISRNFYLHSLRADSGLEMLATWRTFRFKSPWFNCNRYRWL